MLCCLRSRSSFLPNSRWKWWLPTANPARVTILNVLRIVWIEFLLSQQSRAHPSIELFSPTLRSKTTRSSSQLQKPGMPCRCRKHAASCVHQLATQLVSGISGCCLQDFFSFSPRTWPVEKFDKFSKVLVLVLSVFPPVPGISSTADSGRLWSLRLVWVQRYDGVQPRWWPIWWSKGFNPVLIRGTILQTKRSCCFPRLPCSTGVSFKSQFGYVWGVFRICLRSVYFPSWDHWVFRAYWLLAASCSRCVFRTRQGYDTALIMAREKGAIGGGGESRARWHGVATLGNRTWVGKPPSKMEV